VNIFSEKAGRVFSDLPVGQFSCSKNDETPNSTTKCDVKSQRRELGDAASESQARDFSACRNNLAALPGAAFGV
jgi:hypothetical protein